MKCESPIEVVMFWELERVMPAWAKMELHGGCGVTHVEGTTSALANSPV